MNYSILDLVEHSTKAMSDTRDRLITAAMRLFHENGFHSTSIAGILAEAGAHAGSLYHFFPTKQDLLLAVLDRYRIGIHPLLLEPSWTGVADPIERIFALLAQYRLLLQKSDCAYGCPIGNLALELVDPDPAVRELLVANFDAWTLAVESCLEDAQERFPGDLDRRRLATFVLTSMEGGVMLSRTHRSLAPFDAAVDALRDYFKRLERADSAAR